jgi:non-specific serine/threonine protein kinase
MGADWKTSLEVFELALGLDASERSAFLDEACADDADLRRSVEIMLAAHDRAAVAAVGPGGLDTEILPPAGARAPRGPVSSLPVGIVVDGKYRIERLLGAGGMGAVYSANHLQLQRAVALKAIRGDLVDNPTTGERFRREAVAVARLRHPNIVTVHDFGVSPDVGAYLVMERLEGRSLRQELARGTRFELATALSITAQICAAVGAAHRAGVVHRDLKPDNVVLEPRDGGVAVKVVDFGLAKLEAAIRETGAALTHEDAIVGTPAYMAPEQCRGEEADARSDVYSIGCLLFEMLTGRPPFTGATPWALVYQQVNDPPPRPSDLAPGLGPAVDNAISRALAKEPAERFETADAFAEALGVASPLAPVARAAATTKRAGNLPHPMTRFVGREREIDDVRAWLSKARLVTLVGPGGIGKTRLALETAARVVDEYEDGVWLVELAPLADPALLAGAVAQTLGVRDEAGRSEAESIEGWLRGKRALLVLDNCEHLVAACADLTARLLRASAGLRVLATSREALAVAGEASWPVPALEVPAGHAADALDCEAVRLFVDRATLVQPTFAATGTVAPAVAEVCRRLEGIPLAIELAAARVRSLSVDQILERLRDRFRLLVSGSRTAPTRQQTLRATLDWSYELLTDDERALLRRASVFAGGWTLEAAEAVCAEPDALDLLTRLVDKSVLVVTEHGGSARFGMLETVREYALERLAESGEAEQTADRHSSYFSTLAETAAPKIVRSEAATWLARLDAEHDNMQAALDRLLERDPAGCVRVAAALSNFWFLHGHYREGGRWLERALERGSGAPAAVLAMALVGAGMLARQRGEPEAGRRYFEAGLRASREADDTLRAAWASINLGVICMTEGDLPAARAHAEATLAHATSPELDPVAASALTLLGEVARLEGESAAARPYYERALEINRRLGLGEAVSVTLNNLGATLLELGDVDGARASYREALSISRALGTKDDIACSLDGLAATASSRGEWALAGRLAGAAAALRDEIGSQIEPADRAACERTLSAVREHAGAAALEAALADGRATPRDRVIDDALSS